MTRPLPIAASLALALLSIAVFAQTPPAAEAPTAAADLPAEVPAAPIAEQAAPAAPAASPAAAPAPLTGDAAKGAQLTYTCQGCHGIPGYKNAYPNFHVPRIGGQTPEYLSSALHEYRKGARKHPTMQAQAESFSEQDIADISAFLSTLKP